MINSADVFSLPQISVALVLFLFPLAYSPGPGNLFFAANGARFGFRATVPSNLGYHIATIFVTIATGFGFDWILHEAPAILIAIRYVGAAYVLYLAWGLARAGVVSTSQEARPASVTDGVILLLLNPKAYLIIALMFTQFTTLPGNNQAGMIVWIAVVFTLNNLIAFSLYAALGHGMTAKWRSPDSAHRLNTFFAVILAAVALWMLFA